MKKTLIAFGAALVCMGAAQAQSTVQLSGLVDMYAGSMKLAGKDRVSELGSGGMTTSWWGVNGTEDLGGGLKANFALGAFFRADTGDSGRFGISGGTGSETFFARDANVSLEGGFGSVKLGRSMAPNFLPTILFNPYGDSFTVSPLVLHANMATNFANDYKTTASDTGWSNQITYSTPSFGGVKANIHYQFGEQTTKTSASNVGVNVLYFGGPLALTAFYEKAEMLSNPTPAPYAAGTSNTNWMLGGSYNFGAAKLYATYGASEKEILDRKKLDQTTYSVGLDLPVTKAGTVKLAYAHTETDLVTGKDTKRQTASFGYDHFLSKRTDAYAVAMYDKDDRFTANKSGTSLAVGVRHRF